MSVNIDDGKSTTDSKPCTASASTTIGKGTTFSAAKVAGLVGTTPDRPFSPTRTHLSRLMKIWRSAGWPVRDAVEIDLLAANWVALSVANTGHETLGVTAAGLKVLTDARERARRSFSP